MARIGSFSGATFAFGEPLSIVHPIDNDFTKARYDPEILNEPGLTEEQRRQLQQQLEELYAAELLARDYRD